MKEFLSQREVDFDERDASCDEDAAQELMSKIGELRVPVTVVNGQTIIGFDRARLEHIFGQGEPASLGVSVTSSSVGTEGEESGVSVGAYLSDVELESVAEKMGLIPGDIIIQVNGRLINSADDFDSAISILSKGSPISLAYLRGNELFARRGTL